MVNYNAILRVNKSKCAIKKFNSKNYSLRKQFRTINLLERKFFSRKWRKTLNFKIHINDVIIRVNICNYIKLHLITRDSLNSFKMPKFDSKFINLE
jgi:hypothetical protein